MGRAWTGLIWLRRGKDGGLLTRYQPSISIQCVVSIYWLQTKDSLLLQLLSMFADGTTSTEDAASRGAVVPSADNFPSCKQTCAHLSCAVRNTLPACRSAFHLIYGQTDRTVNEHGLGPMTLGEFNQRYQCWANPRRDFILIELRTNILAWQEELSHTWN